MSALVQSFVGWLRQNVGWSNSRQSWQERLGLLVLLAGAGLLLRFGGGLALGQSLVLGIAWLMLLALVLRRGWLKLFGPVLLYDMITVGRRSRYFLLRTVYICFLFLVMYWVWSTWSWRLDASSGTSETMARFAENFFTTFMGVQFIALLVLTPAYVAGCIADEKDRRTLEFLLATDLRNREIVLGKLIARLVNLLFIVLAGLPILAFMQFFGGVDPDLLLAGFAAQAVTVFSMAGLSILLSVYSRRPRDAISYTYLILLAYPALALAFWGLAAGYRWTELGFGLPAFLGGSRFTVGDLFGYFNAGNPIYGMTQLGMQTFGGRPRADIIAELNRNYLVFHALVGLVCTTWAIVRLRAIALRETGQVKKSAQAVPLLQRPPVGDNSMVWKEIYVETGLKAGWIGMSMIALLVLASFLPPVIIFIEQGSSSYRFLAESMNAYVRTVGTLVGCLMLLGAAGRGASCISGERDKQTLDALLTTPLSTHDILLAKWLGSTLCMRWLVVWLGLIWILGVVTGGLHIAALLLLAPALLIYTGIFALLGMWFSIVCKTTGRATIWALMSAVFIGGAHWCIWSLCCLAPLLFGRGGRDADFIGHVMAGLTPPAVLGIFAFHGEELKYKEFAELLGFSVVGLIFWAVTAFFLSNVVWNRFDQATGRDDDPQRERMARSLEWSPLRREARAAEPDDDEPRQL